MCDCSYDFVGQWPIFVWSSSFSFVIIHILILTVVIIIIIIIVADPGDGPGGPGCPLIFDQKEARRVEKIFGDRPPPLSQHLDPPLHHTNQLHQHIVTIIISVLIINLKHSSNPVASPPILFLLEQTLQRTT